MAGMIDWESVVEARKLSDGDRISYSKEASDFFILITLGIANPHMWWKQIEVRDKNSEVIKWVEVTTNQARQTLALDTNEQQSGARNGGYLVLWKAKTFGVHTPMYVLANLDQHLTIGTHNFTWIDD